MRLNNLRYLTKIGLRSVWINRLMTVASVAVLVACLTLTGTAFIFWLDAGVTVGYVEDQTDVTVYLLDSTTAVQRQELEASFKEHRDVVRTFSYVSKEEALKQESENLGPDMIAGLEKDNPLPAKYQIKLKDVSFMSEFEEQMRELPFVEDVYAPTDVANSLVGIRKTVSTVGAVVIIVLIAVSILLITNTVRLSVHSRRQEIEIMKYVGATDWFILYPFLIEGVVIGLFSSAIAYWILYFGHSYLEKWMLEMQTTGWLGSLIGNFYTFDQLSVTLIIGFLAAGLITGVLGTLFAVRKHLRV